MSPDDNSEVRRIWKEALKGERMHHAWLLAGMAGLGKMRFALNAAGELVGGQVPAENHPDIYLLTHLPKDDKEEKKRAEGKPYEVKRNITIAQIRAMQQRLTTRPTLGERRAIIINPADDMEPNASNALLKSLEEPPAGTYFFLVSHRPARLLPTIRSRCRTVRFPAFDDQQVRAFLDRQAPDCDADTKEAAIAAAAGSPGKAERFLELGLGPIARILRLICTDGDPEFALRGELVGAVGARPDRTRLEAVLELARSILNQGIGDLGRRETDARIHAHQELVRLSGEIATYNYDAGLLVMEIGTLLAGVARSSELAHG